MFVLMSFFVVVLPVKNPLNPGQSGYFVIDVVKTCKPKLIKDKIVSGEGGTPQY